MLLEVGPNATNCQPLSGFLFRIKYHNYISVCIPPINTSFIPSSQLYKGPTSHLIKSTVVCMSLNMHYISTFCLLDDKDYFGVKFAKWTFTINLIFGAMYWKKIISCLYTHQHINIVPKHCKLIFNFYYADIHQNFKNKTIIHHLHGQNISSLYNNYDHV